jgi:DNA-binding CsgD family transcriptional regulator
MSLSSAAKTSSRQIAQQLFITSSTVSFHLGRIYAKTGVHSRHQLTQLLREQPLAG